MDEANKLLERSTTAKDVTNVIIDQINCLDDDIKEIEELKEYLKNILPKDGNSYRNAYVIENKIKTFTAFYTTLLSYKREIHSLLFKLRELLTGGGSVEEFKTALRAVIAERNSIKTKTDENKERIVKLLEETPSLMPKEL